MPVTRRTKAIVRLKAVAVNPLVAVDDQIVALRKLALLNPGKPLRHFVRVRLKEIMMAHKGETVLVIEYRDILCLLTEARLNKAKLALIKKEKPVPPFAVPAEFAGQFQWRFRIDVKRVEVVWQLNQV